MKKISLKPVNIPMPRDVSREVQMSIAKAETTLQENMSLIEDAINKIIEVINNGNDE